MHAFSRLLPQMLKIAVASLVLAACTGEGDEESMQSGSESESGGDTTGLSPCASDEDCGGGVCNPETSACEYGGCEPEVAPMPRDEVGDPCCTKKAGCSGYDSMGDPPNKLYLGETLVCHNGAWALDPSYCEGTCAEGREYIGCFWNSAQGEFVKPTCACQ